MAGKDLNKEIDLTKVVELLDLHDGRDDNSKDKVNDSPLHRTRNAIAKTVRSTPKKNKKTVANSQGETDTVSTVINSLVRVVTELVGKVAVQEASIQELSKEKSVKDELIKELQSQLAFQEEKSKKEKVDLENKIKENGNFIDNLQNRLTDSSNAEKIKEVKKECDESVVLTEETYILRLSEE